MHINILRLAVILFLSGAMMACDSSDSKKNASATSTDSTKNASATPPPAGMISAIREDGAWRFRILVGTSGYNTSTSVKVRLNGKDIPSSLSSTVPASLPNASESYMDVSLSDEMVKTGVLDMWDTHSSNRGEETIHYTVHLAELTK